MGADSDRDLRVRLSHRVRGRRDELGLTQQELADSAGVGVNTIIRMEQAVFASKRGPSWAKIERALGWPPNFIQKFLAGQIDDDLETRYQRDAVPEGELSGLIHDMIFEAFAGAAPDMPISKVRRAEELAIETARRAGYRVALRHEQASTGIGEGSNN